jgi:hypothetical protein
VWWCVSIGGGVWVGCVDVICVLCVGFACCVGLLWCVCVLFGWWVVGGHCVVGGCVFGFGVACCVVLFGVSCGVRWCVVDCVGVVWLLWVGVRVCCVFGGCVLLLFGVVLCEWGLCFWVCGFVLLCVGVGVGGVV